MANDPVRDEAERLIAAAIAAVSMAARGFGTTAGRSGSTFANGSAECCVCPVCRMIAAMRDPDADVVDRLSAGAGDLAAGVASLLRALSGDSTGSRESRQQSREGDDFWESLRRQAAAHSQTASADPWRAATAQDTADTTSGGGTPRATTPMAKKVAKKAAPKTAAANSAESKKPEPRKAAPKKAASKKATPRDVGPGDTA